TTSGSTPARRSVSSRAGDADARTNLKPNGLGDDALHDLARAAVDAGDAGVGVAAGDRVLGHVSVAAVQLDAPVDDAPLQLGAVELGLGGVRRAELRRVQAVDAAVDVGLRHLDLGGDLGEHELRVLERADGRAER